MAKKEKIVDLKSKPEKISEEHLKQVQSLINSVAKYQVEIGQLETRKQSLLNYISDLQKEIEKVRDVIKEEYGTEDINIDDGTINYKENGKVNS
jgi:FtsZ-binding cell division protein ZapB|tara:strand:+ start:217 stop:498 length:282 start_codon:yes stop_codon:yes gene_type:complete